jgi:hypothetical protein
LRKTILVLAVLLLGGCNAKFKKAVATMDDVRSEAFTRTQPNVQLGMLYGNDVVSAVVNTAQAVGSVAVERRIARAVNPAQVAGALQAGLGEGLGGGPPFTLSQNPKADGLVDLDVESWGMSVPHLGAQGVFYYQVKATVYLPSGKRIYHHRVTCSSAVGAPPEVSMAFGTVNNVKQLKEMGDDQIERAFEVVARWCGTVVARRMRSAAG